MLRKPGAQRPVRFLIAELGVYLGYYYGISAAGRSDQSPLFWSSLAKSRFLVVFNAFPRARCLIPVSYEVLISIHNVFFLKCMTTPICFETHFVTPELKNVKIHHFDVFRDMHT